MNSRRKDFGAQADAFLKAYSAATDEEAVRVTKDYAGDKFIAYSTWAWLEAQVKTGNAPVFRYSFDLGSPGDLYHPASYGAFHSDDIEYVFGNLDSRKGATWRPEDYKLSDLMQTYWTNFAKTGNPNSPGLAKLAGVRFSGRLADHAPQRKSGGPTGSAPRPIPIPASGLGAVGEGSASPWTLRNSNCC